MTDRALPIGVVTPLVVFQTESGAADRAATKALVELQIAAGVRGLLVNGSIGEVGNLAPGERSAALRAVVEAAAGQVPTWAGVAGLGTADTVTAALEAEADGADTAPMLPPLFFDASDADLARHFRTVAAAAGIPVLAYDVPPRTPRKLPVSLVRDLAEEGVLRELKDSVPGLSARPAVEDRRQRGRGRLGYRDLPGAGRRRGSPGGGGAHVLRRPRGPGPVGGAVRQPQGQPPGDNNRRRGDRLGRPGLSCASPGLRLTLDSRILDRSATLAAAGVHNGSVL